MVAKNVKEPKEEVESILRLIGWQVAAGVLFLAFGLEFAISNAIFHALQPFETGKNALAILGMQNAGLQGFSATALIIVGSLNLGVAAYRFARVLKYIDDRR